MLGEFIEVGSDQRLEFEDKFYYGGENVVTRIRASGKAKGPNEKILPDAWPIDRMCLIGAKPTKGKYGKEWARIGEDGKSWACRGEVCPAGRGTDLSRHHTRSGLRLKSFLKERERL
ncbi:hypothetical protein AtEden1_Chr3g0191101 [Arabidopsis thaliana]